MKRIAIATSMAVVAVALTTGLAAAQQPTSKDTTSRITTSGGDIEFAGTLGYTLRPGAAPLYCNAADSAEVARVKIETEHYKSGMISPEQAKAVALCAVPGQISSGEIESNAGRAVYDISLIPNDKKTYTKIQIDAYTGEVVNAKQFGGLRGLAGFLRESAERKNNKAKSPND